MSLLTDTDLAAYASLFILIYTLSDAGVFLFNVFFLVARSSVYFPFAFHFSKLALPLFKLLVARMDYKARDILAVLKNVNLSVDAKVTHLLGLKSDIKQKNVPEKAVPVIFECLRHAIASPFHALYSAGFSTLGHFLKRLYIQEHHQLVAAMSDRILPALVDRMGDNKDRIRQQTTHALADLWEGAGPQIENLVLSVGFQGKNPFQKQTCLNLLSIVCCLCSTF